MEGIPKFLQRVIDRSPFLTRLAEVADLYIGRRLGRAAAAFAYYLMLSFFPLLICVSGILGQMHLDPDLIIRTLTGIIPPQVIETLIGFFQYINTNYSLAMLWAGIILMVTSASGAFSTLMTSMGDLYGHKRYSGLLHTVMSGIYSIVFILMMYVSIALIATGGWFISLLDEWFQIGEILADWQWLRFVLLTAVIIAFLCIIYRNVSPRQKPALPILPGAASAALLILIVSIVFSYMIGVSVRYALVYGSLASLIILMLWLHLIGSIILLGGTINLVYWKNHPAGRKRSR